MRNFLFILLLSLSWSQIRVGYELYGKFEDTDSKGAFLLGYDHIILKQKNVNFGIGFQASLNESPESMRFNSLYSIVNYNVEETWNMYSKLGLSYCIDDTNVLTKSNGIFIGIGANYNFNDLFHLESGYHISYIDGYEYSRFILSFIKHFEMKE